MGYESRIYVVSKLDSLALSKKGKKYGTVIASINMGVCPGLPEIFDRKAPCYIYSDDYDEHEIVNDRYGKELTESSIPKVIAFLEKEIESGEDYRRIKPLLGLLKGFDMKQWKNLVCLHYWY